MSESTLTAAYTKLRVDLGYSLGYTRTVANWNSRQIDNVAAALEAGLRQFYYCGYDWSFLKPMRDVILHNGSNVVPLPGDYAAMDGPVIVSATGQSGLYRQLALGPPYEVTLREKAMPATPGAPLVLCEEVIEGTTGNNGQRMRLRVWPQADADYTLTFPMRILPAALTGELPYAYGGAQHSQTLLQSCKAAAERDIDGIGAGDPRAVHQPEFAKQLELSQQMDRRTKPHTVGRMRDASDLRRRRTPGAAVRPLLPISVQGTVYD